MKGFEAKSLISAAEKQAKGIQSYKGTIFKS